MKFKEKDIMIYCVDRFAYIKINPNNMVTVVK